MYDRKIVFVKHSQASLMKQGGTRSNDGEGIC